MHRWAETKRSLQTHTARRSRGTLNASVCPRLRAAGAAARPRQHGPPPQWRQRPTENHQHTSGSRTLHLVETQRWHPLTCNRPLNPPSKLPVQALRYLTADYPSYSQGPLRERTERMAFPWDDGMLGYERGRRGARSKRVNERFISPCIVYCLFLLVYELGDAARGGRGQRRRQNSFEFGRLLLQ